MSPREAAAIAMVLAGATRRAACDEHAVYPANLRRAMSAMTGARGDMQPEYSPLGKKIEKPKVEPKPTPLEHNPAIQRMPDGTLQTVPHPLPKAPL